MQAKAILLSAASLMLIPAVFAQGPINQRKDNQQERIGKGVESGQLTPRETTNLERKETALNHEEHRMRAQDNGHLTAADRVRLNHQQNHLSRNIYAKKHNARTR